MSEYQELREKIALSCRIIAMHGLVEGILGHVSVKVPGTDEMLIRCRGEEEYGLPFTLPSAIRRVNFDGDGQDLGDRYEVPKEYPIHGEIYKARPEVGCVIHAHPPAALICGISELEFRPIFGAFNIPAMRMALEGIPVFPRSVLVSRPDLAAPMIDIMGDKNICLMKGHGITVTGRTVEEATVRALNFNILAQATLEVGKTGKEAANISAEDIEELPDLGPLLPEGDKWVWRYHVKLLEDKGWGLN
ncbi:class II aldolase/adducin family protein [Fictibacillus enclensis]|uniref:class II aldolase/adducin family protein n=1 Tax=Fictibacillus enclensis TaxID=1017270 RepID=UPI0025A14DC7|nr:class II aldolase/adducin family protein [Fictibacillus enclensis]MDM5196697.1 class II aldolase/adducin family protein [Fictibacillus enclensis]